MNAGNRDRIAIIYPSSHRAIVVFRRHLINRSHQRRTQRKWLPENDWHKRRLEASHWQTGWSAGHCYARVARVSPCSHPEIDVAPHEIPMGGGFRTAEIEIELHKSR